MKIVFLGTSHFAAQILSHLFKNNFEIQAVVTRPDRPQGRSLRTSAPPVKVMAEQLSSNLPVHQPEKASSLSLQKC